MGVDESYARRRRRSERRGLGRLAGVGRGGGECGAGRGPGRRDRAVDESGLRAAGRRLVVVTLAAIADDMRDPDGLVRPAMRRLAARLCESRLLPANRAGAAYLRLDPPRQGLGPTVGEDAEAVACAARDAALEGADVVDAEAVELPDDADSAEAAPSGVG